MCWTPSGARSVRRCGHASPAAWCGRLCCCNTATTRKSSPGTYQSRVLLDADGPEDYEETLTAFDQANKTAREQFTSYLAAKLRGDRGWSSTRSTTTLLPAMATDPAQSNPVGERPPGIQEGEHGEATRGWPGWARLAWKRWKR